MTRVEVFVVAAYAVLSLTVGLTWLFGPLGLIGLGVALGVAAFLVNVRE